MRFVSTYVNSGDFYFCRDNAYFAWLTKYYTAGWARRDDMTVPSHVGFLWKPLFGQCYFIEADGAMPGNAISLNPISKRFNQPNDCPGIMEIWRPRCCGARLVGQKSYGLSQAEITNENLYYRTGMIDLLPQFVGTGTYDYLKVLGYAVGITAFGSKSWMVCSEFVYTLLKTVFSSCFLYYWRAAGSSSRWFVDGQIYQYKWWPSAYLYYLTGDPSPVQIRETANGIYHTVVSKSLWSV